MVSLKVPAIVTMEQTHDSAQGSTQHNSGLPTLVVLPDPIYLNWIFESVIPHYLTTNGEGRRCVIGAGESDVIFHHS